MAVWRKFGRVLILISCLQLATGSPSPILDFLDFGFNKDASAGAGLAASGNVGANLGGAGFDASGSLAASKNLDLGVNKGFGVGPGPNPDFIPIEDRLVDPHPNDINAPHREEFLLGPGRNPRPIGGPGPRPLPCGHPLPRPLPPHGVQRRPFFQKHLRALEAKGADASNHQDKLDTKSNSTFIIPAKDPEDKGQHQHLRSLEEPQANSTDPKVNSTTPEIKHKQLRSLEANSTDPNEPKNSTEVKHQHTRAIEPTDDPTDSKNSTEVKHDELRDANVDPTDPKNSTDPLAPSQVKYESLRSLDSNANSTDPKNQTEVKSANETVDRPVSPKFGAHANMAHVLHSI